MKHPEPDQILGFVEKTLDATSSEQVGQHLGDCPRCATVGAEFRSLSTVMAKDAAFEPPASLVEWGVSLFQPLVRPEFQIGTLRRIIASLVFDTYQQPLPAGVRGAVAAPRQLLFRAGDVDVDVKIESTENNDQISLVGQVLSKSRDFLSDTPVRLESHGVVRYRTRTNPVGEFTFDEVPKDTYHLSMDLPEGQVTLFCVHKSGN